MTKSGNERFQTITASCRLNGKGLEIGPAYSGMCRKADGFDVEILDHMDRPGLLEKYRQDPNVSAEQLARIEEVDYVWSGGSYRDATGKTAHYDYIIASHVIEHVTDVIGFLKDCAAMLKEGGVLSLAVPDKRYTFDHFRTLTGIGAVIDDHLAPRPVHSWGHMVDQWVNATNMDGHIAYSRLNLRRGAPFTSLYGGDAFFSTFAQRSPDADYQDCHHSVFTPSSLRLILWDLYALGYIDLAESFFAATPAKTSEFYVALHKQPNGQRVRTAEERLALLKQIEREQAEAAKLLGLGGEKRGAKSRLWETAYRTAKRLQRRLRGRGPSENSPAE